MAVLPTPSPDKSMAAGMSEGDNLYGSSTNHRRHSDEIFGNRYRRKDHIESFAEVHVKLAKQTGEEQLWAGRKLIEGVQGGLLISLSTARWRVTPYDLSFADHHLVVLVQCKVCPIVALKSPSPSRLEN